MGKTDLPISILSLLAVIGFGVVLAGSGFHGMTPDPTLALSGVAIIFADMAIWTPKAFFHKKQTIHYLET